MKKDYRKYFKWLFVALLLFFLSIDISFGASPISFAFICPVVGLIYLIKAYNEIKEVSPKFKLTLIFGAIYTALTIYDCVSPLFLGVVSTAEIISESTVITIPPETYKAIYISIIPSVLINASEALAMIFALGGLVDFVNNENIKPLIDDCERQYKKIKIIPFVYIIISSITSVLTVPLLHSIDGLDLETLSGPLPAQITAAMGILLVMLLVTICGAIFAIIYLVRYIKGLVLVNKFSNVAPLEYADSTEDNVIDVTPTEEPKDDWKDDFK